MEIFTTNRILAEGSEDLFLRLESLNHTLECNLQQVDSITSDLIDSDFLNEIRNLVNCSDISVYFGKTLRDLKIVIQDDSRLRDHEIFLQYTAPKKLIISNVKLPHASILNREYRYLVEVIEILKKYINDLAKYFYELEYMDQLCTVMEPLNASFKDDYRRILLDDRTWLHVEVTPEGLATNVHLVGQSVYWNNKLQSGLLIWDHDKNIVENIMTIFDLTAFPQPTLSSLPKTQLADKTENELVCGICLCAELPEASGIPQPLCQNPTCGVYYHRNCLYQWLVACAGSRPPAFGVANGACPTCLQPVTCSEKDS